jgi:dolichyl-phosphate beta-glucosyltransferase
MTIAFSDFTRARPAAAPRAARTRIVVPCYNEAERLDAGAFLEALDSDPATDFTFVDDGSGDATLETLTALQAVRPERITVLALARNSGKAEAVRQGLLHAAATGAAHVGYWDADLATPLDAIPDFVRVMERFADLAVVFGSRRALLGHRIERTLKRRIVSRLCGALARQAIRLPVADTQCGAKLLRTGPALDAALAMPFTAGWLFDVELFARLSARIADRARAFYELPLPEWDEVAGSKVTGRAILRSGLQMLRLIAEIRLGLAARSVALGASAICVQPAAFGKAA